MTEEWHGTVPLDFGLAQVCFLVTALVTFDHNDLSDEIQIELTEIIDEETDALIPLGKNWLNRMLEREAIPRIRTDLPELVKKHWKWGD